MATFPMTDNPQDEIWKPVKGYESEYFVSSLGNVMSKDRIQERSNGKVMCKFNVKGKMLYPYMTGKGEGYLTVRIHGKMRKVHRLVAEAFIPNPQNKPQVNHKDGNKKNNCVDNLEWVTNEENAFHAYKNGLTIRGEKTKSHKLTEQDVLRIRSEYKQGERGCGIQSLAAKYGVAYTTIKNVVSHKKWRHI